MELASVFDTNVKLVEQAGMKLLRLAHKADPWETNTCIEPEGTACRFEITKG